MAIKVILIINGENYYSVTLKKICQNIKVSVINIKVSVINIKENEKIVKKYT